MDQLMADIAIGGDIKNVVHRDDLTWPEVVLMRDIHGEAAVTNVEITGASELDPDDEITRLRTRYGRKFVRVFGRSATRIPMQAPSTIPRWDDEVEIKVRTRRQAALTPNPAAVETEAERRDRALYQMGGDPPKPKPDDEDEEDGEDEEEEVGLQGVSADDSVTHRKRFHGNQHTKRAGI